MGEPDPVKNFFAGTAAGIVQVLVGQPFDTVKVRLQAQGENPLYHGTGDCVKKIIKNEGLSAFYKGTLPPLVGIGLCVSIQFAAVEQAKNFFRKQNQGGPLNLTQFYLAGAFAGVANSVVSGPVEHIRTRLQVQVTSPGKAALYSGPVDCVKKIYATNGISGIYKGQAITILREFQGYGGYFLAYELATREFTKMNGGVPISGGWVMLCGALGGFGMWIPVYPVDVIKSRMQTDTFGAEKYRSTWDCVRQTYKMSGIRGFYKGFLPCLLRTAPVNGATFFAFEMSMRIMGRD